MEKYYHYQKGKTPLLILSIPLVVMVLLISRGLSQGRGFQDIWQLAAGSVLVLAGMVLMSGMKTTVTGGSLTIRIGPVLTGKTIPVSEISGIQKTEIPWYSSGIKKIRGGWLFSVNGSPALEINLRSGKRFIVGTDDPDGLARAIEDSIQTVS
jgi:hypothetical protein